MANHKRGMSFSGNIHSNGRELDAFSTPHVPNLDPPDPEHLNLRVWLRQTDRCDVVRGGPFPGTTSYAYTQASMEAYKASFRCGGLLTSMLVGGRIYIYI